MSDILDELEAVVYEEGWDYLDIHNPELADKIKRAVAAGKQPDEIRSRFLRSAGDHRIELAKRVENAARHLWSLK